MAIKDWKNINEDEINLPAGEFKKAWKKKNYIIVIYKEFGTYVVEYLVDNKYKPWHYQGTYSGALKYVKNFMRTH